MSDIILPPQIIPIIPTNSQSFSVTLGNQSCQINIYTKRIQVPDQDPPQSASFRSLAKIPKPVVPFEIGSVFPTQLTATYGRHFPPMEDSPYGSFSVWVYLARNQGISFDFYPPQQPVGGNLFANGGAYLLANIGPFGSAQYLAIGCGGFDSTLTGNQLIDVSATNPAVWTFSAPHGLRGASSIYPFSISGSNDSAYYPAPGFVEITSVTDTTATVNYDATAATGPFLPVDIIFQVLNSISIILRDSTLGKSLAWQTSTPIPSDELVNLKLSWDTAHPAGEKIIHCYYGDEEILPYGGVIDVDDSFSVYYSAPDTSPNDGNEGWYAVYNNVGFISEYWFAAGQFIDFSTAANRAKFRDSTTNKAVSLYSDGSKPTGSIPTIYLSQPLDGNTNTMPVAAIDCISTFGAYADDTQGQLKLNSMTMANGIVNSSTLVCSFWTDIFASGVLIDVPPPVYMGGNITLGDGVCTVALGTDFFNGLIFSFPYTTGNGQNIRFAVDLNHPIGSKVIHAYVGNLPADVTILLDNVNNLVLNWTVGSPTAFNLIRGLTGYVGDLWIAPDQFFDPVNDFINADGSPVDLGPTGQNTSAGIQPSFFFHIGFDDVAASFATNRGSAGPCDSGVGVFSLETATHFFKNKSGLSNLNISPSTDDFEVVPSSFSPTPDIIPTTTTIDQPTGNIVTDPPAFAEINPIFLDLYINDVLVLGGVLALNNVGLVRDPYLGFVGDLSFTDIQGNEDPQVSGLGIRWLLCYWPNLK